MNATPNDESPKETGKGKNNRNALRHGLRAGKLPDDCQYVELRLNSLRRTLEDAVVRTHGEVSETQAAIILQAIDWERHRCLCQRWMRKKAKELSLTELVKLSEGMAKGSTELSRAIKMLDIDRDNADSILDALYARGKAMLANGDGAGGADDK
ncbi:MAG: hypothetical protein L0Y72_18905 [Gemmataceae bacterium]|nr:hypothetical protein [Gemmataceae bacterium]MCI0741119.1 hypothetical protein [Gemmataceae bacterium]